MALFQHNDTHLPELMPVERARILEAGGFGIILGIIAE